MAHVRVETMHCVNFQVLGQTMWGTQANNLTLEVRSEFRARDRIYAAPLLGGHHCSVLVLNLGTTVARLLGCESTSY